MERHVPACGGLTAEGRHPKLRHRVLTIEGDTIALRLQAGDPGILHVDAGGDGSSDFSFQPADVASIAVDALADDDVSDTSRSESLMAVRPQTRPRLDDF